MRRLLFLSITILLLLPVTIFANSINDNTILQQAPTLKPKLLRLGVTAYEHALQHGFDKSGIVTLVDYTDPSTAKRLWVVDLHTDKVLFNTLVAHGKGSGANYARRFSNHFNSDASSIGVYRTGKSYYGNDGYSLHVHGLDKGFDTNAYRRTVEVHGAWYVSEKFIHRYGRLGRTLGCFGLTKHMAKPVINTIKNGTILIAYYPDKAWLDSSQYLRPVTS